MSNKGVKLITCELTPLQMALIEWGRQNPYAKICELSFQDGVPVSARVLTADGNGTEVISFSKFAKRAGLIK